MVWRSRAVVDVGAPEQTAAPTLLIAIALSFPLRRELLQTLPRDVQAGCGISCADQVAIHIGGESSRPALTKPPESGYRWFGRGRAGECIRSEPREEFRGGIDMPTRIPMRLDPAFLETRSGRSESAPRYETAKCDRCRRWTLFVRLPFGDLRCTTCGTRRIGARTFSPAAR